MSYISIIKLKLILLLWMFILKISKESTNFNILLMSRKIIQTSYHGFFYKNPWIVLFNRYMNI